MEEDIYYKKDNIKVNLTKLFEKGNEPTLEEIEAIFPRSYYTYEEGTRVSSIKLILSKILVKFKIRKL